MRIRISVVASFLAFSVGACKGDASAPSGTPDASGIQPDDAGHPVGDAGQALDGAERPADASGSADGTGSPDAAAPADAGSAADAGSVFAPRPGTSWQWQLTGTIDTRFDVAMYDIDLFEAPQGTIDELHGAGRVVICYFSAGSYEEWRIDAAEFPSAGLGKALEGWPGERWLDVRHAGVRQVVRARLDRAVAKRCDGVEPDNVDGYANDSGFPLTASDQLDFNRFLAAEAHARQLSIGLKNDLDQVPDLLSHFDWALDEECVAWGECARLSPFIQAGKAVFHVEYGDASLATTVCPATSPLGFSTLIKNLDLDAPRTACP
jgi:hypothetical protein